MKGFFYTPMNCFLKIPRLLRFLVCGLAVLFKFCSALQAQIGPPSNPFVRTRFLKDSLSIEESQFYFNSLQITNISAQVLELRLRVEPTCFTNLVTAQEQSITLQPNETENFAIRFTGNNNVTCASDWGSFKALIVSPAINFQLPISFSLKPTASYKWKAVLPQPLTIITEKDRKISFPIRIENLGSVEDKYSISFANEYAIVNRQAAYIIAAGGTATEQIEIKLSDADAKNFRNKDISIFLENSRGERKALVQKIARLENVYQENGDRWKRIPLTFELNTLGLLGRLPFFFVRVTGNVDVGPNKVLRINYQSPSVYPKGEIQNSVVPTIEYVSPKWNVLAGSFFESNQFLVYGIGFKARRYNQKKNWVEIGYNHSTFQKADQFLGKTGYAFSKRLFYTTNSILNKDGATKNLALVSMHKVQWDFNPTFNVFVEGGGGFQNIRHKQRDTTLKGKSISAGLTKTAGELRGIVNFSHYSRSFPGIYKGYTHYFQDFYWIRKKLSLGTYIDAGNQQPFILRDSAFLDNFNFLLRNYSARIGYSGKKASFILYPGIIMQKQDSLNSFVSHMKKVGINMFYAPVPKWQISLQSNVGFITIPSNKSAGSLFTLTSFLTVQSQKYGAFIRYDVGPYFYPDIRTYLTDTIQRTILQFSPFIYQVFPKWNLDVRTQFNLFLNKPGENASYTATNDILWQHPDKGWGAGINTNLNFSMKNNSFINFFVRKLINVPVIRKKSYKDFKIILFKDENGNGQLDDGELALSDTRIMLDQTLLLSDSKGEILVKNYAGNLLQTDLSTIDNLIGWVPTGGYKQQIPIQKEIRVPFKKARLISGKLSLEKDEKSTLEFDVSSIRITAVGKSGLQFTTLTGSDGTYYLNVLEDEYTLTINENVFSETFKVSDPVRNVDLMNNSRVIANFIVRQKKREINIKKQ
ncbi:MAG: hypothetical protein JWP69_823 [Flaviaesturariibacter sp.]|nr:hypothetical protein [Flaviaesturariibacter sp.]